MRKVILFLFIYFGVQASFAASGIVVFQSDFGIRDGAVSEVKGVMYSVDKSLLVTDLTNEIPPYQIWDASYRLFQTAPYWPRGTVFVSVVDPGVGTARRSIVAETNSGQYFVTPDNGTLTLVNDAFGIKSVRIIDETKNRLKSSMASYTFFGRDVYAYTAAKLASGKINFSEVGPVLQEPIIKLSYQKPVIQDKRLLGTIVIHDPQYGNIWTNINKDLMDKLGLKVGERYKVKIYHNKKLIYSANVLYQNTFGEVSKNQALIYVNSLMNLSLAINQGNFAKTYLIEYGSEWVITIEK